MPSPPSTKGILAGHLVLILLAPDLIWALPRAFESIEASPTAAALTPSQEFPWVSLRLYRRPDDGAAGQSSLQANAVTIVSMQAGDFDEDGIRDLITAVESPSGGLIRFHRGNLAAIYPNSAGAQEKKALGAFTDQPFFAAVASVAVSFLPGLIAAGDFNGDGHLDLAAAAEGYHSLHFLTGDGTGNLNLERSADLGIPITHLIAGDVNRRDGLSDLVVGLSGDRSEVRVYEGPHGAMSARPEAFEIDGPLSALTVGQLDADPAIDIAAAAGREIVLIRGRDRKLSVARPGEAAVFRSYQFDFQIRQLVTGDFRGDYRYELAALVDNGEVQLISFPEAAAFPSSTLWHRPARSAVGPEELSTPVRSVRRLVPARVSTFPKEDLILFEPGSSGFAVLLGDGRSQSVEFDPFTNPSSLKVTYSTSGELMAVLPMRLSPDALDDLVLAAGGSEGVIVVQTTPNNTYTVNTNLAGNDLTDDGICDFDPDPESTLCNWNSALRSANGTPGLDKIDFDIAEVHPPFGQPLITEPILVDGTSQGRVLFNGSLRLSQIGSSTVRGLAMHGASSRLTLQNFGDNIVEDNYFGTIDGETSDSSGWVWMDDSPRNQIGGTTAEARNLFAPTGGTAIQISSRNASDAGSIDNEVRGNYVGTDASGLNPIGGIGIGIAITKTENNTIGSLSPGGRNVVAQGVRLVNAADNLVQGNYIGTDASGTAAIGNRPGIVVHANRNTIGGTISAARNVISGNTNGITLEGTSSQNLIQGNYIGLDATGAAILGNQGRGVQVDQSSNNTIGGVVEGAGNVITGNRDGLSLSTTSTTTMVQRNLIGTDSAGQLVLGNRRVGIAVHGSDHVVGGSEETGNVVVGSQFDGIQVSGTNHVIRGNFIGTDADRTLAGGNNSNGIALIVAENTKIGGTEPGQGNVIAFNGLAGVVLPWGGGHSILGNSIFSNGQLGINANAPDVPVLTSVTDGNIQGSLTATPNTKYRIELFSSAECDLSGFGEGEIFLGALPETTTNESGSVNFVAPFQLQGPAVTATATDPDDNTSSFSNCLELAQDKISITAISPDPALGFPPVNPDLSVSFTQIGVNYTLVTDTSGTVVIRVLAEGDPNRILGEALQNISVTEQQPSGSIVFPEVTATNVTPEINSISVRAFILPTNSEDFTVESEVIYDRGDSVEFVMTTPDPTLPLSAPAMVTVAAVFEFRLTSAQEGFLELQIRDQEGDLLVEPPFERVSSGLNSLPLEATVEVPNDSNTITVDGLLTSGAGPETITEPSVIYHVNRIRMENLNPLPTMVIQGGREQTFQATLDYNIATQTDQGSILLAVLDSQGNLIDPVDGNGQVDDLSTGPGQVDLSTRVFAPEDATTFKLLAVLADLAGDGMELARDEATYQFSLAGRVLILTSGAEIPLVRARVAAEPLVGNIIEDFTDDDGVYRLPLARGTYKLTAEPPHEDRALRVPEEMMIEVDELRNSLPDFELGAVNRGDQVIQHAIELGMLGENTAAVNLIDSLDLFPARPYSDEIEQLKGFADSQPAPPEETEEGLYRLFLATRAATALAEDASGLLKDPASTIAGFLPGLALLDKFDGKIKEALKALIRNQTTRVLGSIIESMEAMFTGVLNRVSSLASSMRS